VHAHIAGELWGRRGQDGILNDAHIELDAHAQRLVFHSYTAPDRRGVFEVSRTAIETESGEIIEERTDPAAAFAGQTTTTHWDYLNVVYTAGFDLWNYFTAPFTLAMPGVHTEEIEPWEEAGEKWRRLKAVFPEGFVGHSPEQIYSFNSAGLLRRFDYQPKLGGVPANVNYAADHKQFDGLMIATRRRMLPSDSDGRSRREPVLMTIDVLDLQIDK
jgi:hypothetical protein